LEQNNAKGSPKRLIDDPELCACLGDISSTTLWRLRRKGVVPPPVKVGRLNGTPVDEVNEVIARLMAQRCGGRG
jgi:predicted DNA-binding transcriptional regulator AlpA